jgi:hypothetical protein
MPITTSLFACLAMELRAAASFNDWQGSKKELKVLIDCKNAYLEGLGVRRIEDVWWQLGIENEDDDEDNLGG